MNRCLLALVAFATGFASGEDDTLPRLTVEGRPLFVAEAIVSVEVEGLVAEIVYELAYRNDSTRRVEGEFSLPLPDGATVSTFAIDVPGAMRPAVSVEKEQALNAYESIKRRKVDPGIVERKVGNLYRTRVFPIEPNSERRVRIGYLRTLDPHGRLDLPITCANRVGRLEVVVKGAAEAPQFAEPPDHADIDTTGGDWKWTAQQIRPSALLAIQSLRPEQPLDRLRIESAPDGTRHFALQGRIGPRDETIPPLWRRIRLVWDASYSGRFRDHQAELDALDRIWKWLGEAEVTVHTLSTGLSPGKPVPVKEGDGHAVRDALAGTVYDGSADYSQLAPFDGITLLVGDGIVSSPVWSPPPGGSQSPLFLLNGTGLRPSPEMAAFADAVVDPGGERFLDVLKEHLDAPRIEGIGRDHWCFVRLGPHYRLTGALPPSAPAKLKIHGGGMAEREIGTKPSAPGNEWNFTRRLWAQDRLAELEARQQRSQILEHAVSERLASDLTSLIVLERMEDHVRYRIPPPEPELLSDYQRRLAARSSTPRNVRAGTTWRSKLQWFDTEFPWIDTELREEIAAVAIFTQAARQVFDDTPIAGTSVPALEDWLARTVSVADAAAKIDSTAAFGEWLTQAKERFETIRQIRQKSELAEIPDEAFPVSVRGFVVNRGVFSGKAPFLLDQAISTAGGPSLHGSLSRVFLYRDGQRTGYNLKGIPSPSVHLRPGDMVVVEARQYDWLSHSADPFSDSDGFVGRSPATGGAPVFETTGAVKPKTAQARIESRPDPFSSNSTKGTFAEAAPPELPAAAGADLAFLEALRASAAPADFYSTALAGDFGQRPLSAATVVETARFLHAQGETELAIRILTNLCELQPNPAEATRTLALWLCEFGETDRATALLLALLESVPDEGTKALVHLDLARLAGDASHLSKAIGAETNAIASPPLAPIVLTDLFDSTPKQATPFPWIERREMPSDLRIVVTTAGGAADLTVASPHRLSLAKDGVASDETDAGWRYSHPRVSEYQIRRCLPGSYVPSLARRNDETGPVTAQIDIHLHWGRKDMTTRSITVLLDGKPVHLDGIVFEWQKSRPDGVE